MRDRFAVFFVLALMGTASTPALAQSTVADQQTAPDSSETDSASPGDIVVTAQRREQSSRDIGLAINVLGGDDLTRMQASSVGAIADQVPNVIGTTSGNLPAFTVRGVGLNIFASNYDAPVAVYIDDVYRSKPYMTSMPTFDVQRVEVLKGPQGTLFGRNATGGAVNFYSNQPTDDAGGGMNLSIDNHGRGIVNGFVNGGISDDVAARLSYYVAQGSGGPYRDRLNGGSYGKPNQLAARGQIKYQNSGTTLVLSGFGFRDRSELTPYKSPGIYTPTLAYCAPLLAGRIDDDRSACLKYGSNPPRGDAAANRETQSIRDINANVQWIANNMAYGAAARFDQDLGGPVLTSVTSYTHFRRAQTEDADNSPYRTADVHYYSRTAQFTQELRIGGKAGGLNYLIGGYYEHDDVDEFNSVDAPENPILGLPPFAPVLAAQLRQRVRSLAAFTHNEFELAPNLSIVAGARYTNDRTSLVGSTFLGAEDFKGIKQSVTPVIPVDSFNGQRTDSNWSFRGGINWHPTPGNLLFASVSRGFRSGGYSVPYAGPITTFSPEKLTAYEAGAKLRLIDRLLDFNATAYYYDYKNLQVNVDDPASPQVPITRNIGASRNYGIEMDATLRPAEGWTLRTGVSYLDAKLTSTDRVINTYAGVIPLEGKRPVNSPHWTAQASLQKEFALADGKTVTFATDARYTGPRFLSITNQPFDAAPSYWVQNARIALAGKDDAWEVAIWGKNIWNKEYMTYLNNVSFFRIEIYGEPASYGLSANFRF